MAPLARLDHHATPRRHALRRIAAAVALAARGPAAFAQPSTPMRPETVEAAYLLKLPGYVEWPADAFRSPAAAIVVGVAGAPTVREQLVRVAKGRLVLGRAVEARAIESAADLGPDLHVLFIGADAAPELPGLVDAASGLHALVVTDVARGLDAGAAIVFVQVDGRVRFEISLPGARRAGVKLSSQLMGVAWKVVESPS